MTAATLNLELEQGATFYRTLTLKDASGTPFNLTGWVCRGQIRRKHTSEEVAATFTMAIPTPATGTITFALSAAQTAALAAKDHVYDVEIEQTASGEVYRLLSGTVSVSPEVTR